MHDCLLSLDGVGVAYWRRQGLLRRTAYWALREVSFDLYRGETLGVIGRNGVGKSTLLKVIAGIIDPDRGRVLRHQPALASLLTLQVGFVNHLNGRQNAILSGLMLGLSRAEMEARMAEIIAFAELEDAIDQPVHSYSAGMRARLGFSVSLLASPDILLIDETLGVGDASFRQKSAAAIKAKIRSDQTVVVVSHSAGQLRALCDRLVWIEDGRSRAEGPVERVLPAYEAAVTGGRTNRG